MALKDLIAQRASLAEEAIEEIVSSYVRYDPEEKLIGFTPAAANLQNRAKLLVYLVALQGWPFVTDEPVPVDAKPAELSEQTDIPGGTLRPLLKELRERHIVTERKGRYFVRPTSLASIRAEIGNDPGNSSHGPSARKKRQRQASAGESKPSTKSKDRRPATPQKKKGSLANRFNDWINAGYFDEPKTLADTQRRFQKEGVIVPQSRVSPYLLGAVRSGRLTREEAEINKKRVWTYRSAE